MHSLFQLKIIQFKEQHEESSGQTQPGTSSGVTQDDYSLTKEELIGMHCRAPYPRQVDRLVCLHDAVIFDIINENADPESLQVRTQLWNFLLCIFQ